MINKAMLVFTAAVVVMGVASPAFAQKPHHHSAVQHERHSLRPVTGLFNSAAQNELGGHGYFYPGDY
jgi:hypothetical protein